MGLLTQKRATIFHPRISFLCLPNISIFYNFVNKDIKLGLSQKSPAALWKHHRPAEGTPGAWPYGPETWQTIANKYC